MEQKVLAERRELVIESLKDGLSYPEYRTLVQSHAQSFTSTGHTQTEALSKYTLLNNKRMKRWDKTFKLQPEHIAFLKDFSIQLNWVVLTESWCGDAAPSIPVMYAIAKESPAIDLKIVLRDDHPQLMDAFLTNGSKAIPKLIIQDAVSEHIYFDWGSRPAPAAKMVRDYKEKHGKLSAAFREELQLWYNKDKGKSTEIELMTILKEIKANLEIEK